MSQAPGLSVSERTRVLTQAVVETARRLALKAGDLKDIIGTSQPTVSRLLHGQYELSAMGKTWELGQHLVRLYRSLSSMVGGDDALARVWLCSANRDFDGRAPLEVIKRVDGLIHVCEYLDAYRARV